MNSAQHSVELRVFGARKHTGFPRQGSVRLGVSLCAELLVVVRAQPFVRGQRALRRPLNGVHHVNVGMHASLVPIGGIPYSIR